MGVTIYGAFCAIVIALSFWGCSYLGTHHPVCDVEARGKVIALGGCNRDAFCSVMLDDGHKLTYIKSPVVGETLHECLVDHEEPD